MGHQTLFLLGIPWLFFPLPLQIVATIVAMTAFFHNGGRFYVDHFWKAYERNTLMYLEQAQQSMKESDATRRKPSSPSRRKSKEDRRDELTDAEISGDAVDPHLDNAAVDP